MGTVPLAPAPWIPESGPEAQPSRALGNHLVVHGVHAVRSQGLDGLADEICPSTVEHAETQVLVELFRSRAGI